MCGIFVVFSTCGKVDKQRFFESLDTISHRGPDGTTYWISDDQRVALGHTRLSIIDIDGGTQPIFNEDDSVVIVVNGEIYNHKELRELLVRKGHTFKTKSDSEVILHLYEEDSEKFVEQLNGEFSFVIWDNNKKKMYCGRDHAGIKPLFYSYQNGMWCFSSEIKAIFKYGLKSEWNLSELEVFCTFGTTRPGYSIFKNIEEVRPGFISVVEGQRISSQKYWDCFLQTSSLLETEDIEQKFLEILSQSVERRLRADVPVAMYLSGGIDSCTILALANQILSKPIETFTVKMVQKEFDEASQASELSMKFGSINHSILVNEQDLIDYFEKNIWNSETICFNLHGVAKQILGSYVRSAGYKVMLSGEGADELLYGYPHFKMDYSAQYEVENVLTKNSQYAGYLIPTNANVEVPYLNENFTHVPAWIKTQFESSRLFLGILSDEFVNNLKLEEVALKFAKSVFPNSENLNRQKLEISRYTLFKTMLPNYNLIVVGDRPDMANGLEGRVPFLDKELINFVIKVGGEKIVNTETEKILLRNSMRGLLPKDVISRRKKPFVTPPFLSNTKGNFFCYLNDLVSCKQNIPSFLDFNKLNGFLKYYKNSGENFQRQAEPLLYAIMSFVCLQKVFRINN